MSDVALPGSIGPAHRRGPNLDGGFHPLTGIIYTGVVAAALLYVAYNHRRCARLQTQKCAGPVRSGARRVSNPRWRRIMTKIK